MNHPSYEEGKLTWEKSRRGESLQTPHQRGLDSSTRHPESGNTKKKDCSCGVSRGDRAGVAAIKGSKGRGRHLRFIPPLGGTDTMK